MAKAKKKEALSLEEKLKNALVPVDEQPYEVPENWCFFRFTSLIDIEGGTQPPKSHFVSEPLEGYVRLVQIRDFASDKYIVYVPDTKKLRKFNKNDIMIARYGASIGRICTGLEGAYNVALAKTIFSEKVLNREYVYWMLQSETFQNPLTSISRSAQAGFNKEDLYGFIMPLPPLAEQQRIVEQIESLFAKLDEAKEKVLEAITSSQHRKDTLLHKAFEGELTRCWREKNNVVSENNYYLFDECILKMQNGLAKRNGSTGKEFAVIRLANLSADGFITEDMRMILLDEKEQENYRLYADDVVMIRVNGSKDNVARQICVESDTEWAFCDHIIRIRYDEAKVLPRFMVYFSKSQYYCNYIADNMVSSAGQNTISRKGMSNLTVPNFMLEEQQEIIKILDKLWKSEDEIQIKAEQVVEQIDLMKKSILAKAFRGELGTNNPDEESAVELLKKIITEE